MWHSASATEIFPLAYQPPDWPPATARRPPISVPYGGLPTLDHTARVYLNMICHEQITIFGSNRDAVFACRDATRCECEGKLNRTKLEGELILYMAVFSFVVVVVRRDSTTLVFSESEKCKCVRLVSPTLDDEQLGKNGFCRAEYSN